MILEPEIFKDHSDIAAGFSTRRGGVSEGAYTSLNLGLSTNDDEKHVLENRRRFCERLSASTDQLAIAGQVHGHKVKHITEPGLFGGFDGLVTTAPELLLAISAADCAAVLMADLDANVIGACHSGWRGTAAGIAPNTAAAMQTLGARPERIRAYISPCISVDHFEVGPEVAEQFAPKFVVQMPGKEKPHVDLKAAIAAELQRIGLLPEHIEASPHCTHADSDQFFSYRAGNGTTGRMMGVIGLT